MKFKDNKLNIAIRFLIGVIFIISSILKLISIDSFEIYIYSFGVLNLGSAFLLARFIISFELLSGIFLITGNYLKKVIFASIILLFVFSIFIVFLFVTHNDEHCHCFGDVFEMSHILSILKNIILITFLALIYRTHRSHVRNNKFILLFSLILSISLPQIISPPDFIYYRKYSKNVNYNEILLEEYLKENTQFTKGKKILCFYGTSCRFCKLATRKISVIANKLHNSNEINCVFWGSEESVNSFFKENKSVIFKYSFLPTEKFLRITNGEMPLIILLEDGNVKKKYGYRSINEHEIINFMRN